MSMELRGNYGEFENEARTKQEEFKNEPRTNPGKISNEQLVARIQAGECETENMLLLWQQSQGFIGMIAIRFSGYAELEDLKQEGYIGLCEAVSHYDAETGVPFINYAAFWIKQIMQRYIENCGGVVRIPSGMVGWVRKYKKMLSEFKKYGKEPTEREICALLEIGQDKLQHIKKAALISKIRSIHEPLGEDGNYTLGDTVKSGEDLEDDCVRRVDTAVMIENLWEAIDKLPEGQQSVIKYRYRDNMTLKEAGQELGVTIEAVRQLQNQALRTLRLPSRSEKFRGYYEEYLQAACYRHIGVKAFQRNWTSEVEREVLALFDA